MTAKQIYDEIKSGDNKKIWAFAQELHELKRRASKVGPDVDVDWSNEEEVRAFVIKSLLKQTSDGNAVSTKELTRLFNIGEKERQLIIEVVDFARAYPENTTPAASTEVLSNELLESSRPGGEESSDIVAS